MLKTLIQPINISTNQLLKFPTLNTPNWDPTLDHYTPDNPHMFVNEIIHPLTIFSSTVLVLIGIVIAFLYALYRYRQRRSARNLGDVGLTTATNLYEAPPPPVPVSRPAGPSIP